MDMELEEGEACSFPNDNTTDHGDYGANMDPDIALSYLDKKVEHVLGHWQKDFEGAVSAEDLGSKFGAYGSFLPTYQRSPIWSHLAPKNNHYPEPRSPNNLQLESGCRSSITSLTAPQSIKRERGCASAASLPPLKASSSVTGSTKQEKCMSSKNFANEIAPKRETINKTSANLSENKLLKVRIKVGLDNPSTQNIAAIYSGLGLDVSPSSTVEESPSGSGMPHEPQDSPEQIFQIMLSSPLDGSLLLSPLPDDVLKLTEEGRRSEERGRLVVPRVGPEMNADVSNDLFLKSSDSILREKKIRSLKSNESKAELKSEKWKDYDLADVSPKNQIAENSAFENTTKAMSSAPKEPLKPVGRDKIGKPIREDIMIENGKFASTKVQEDSGVSYVSKDEHRKVEKLYGSTKKVSNTSNGGEDLCSEPTDSVKPKVSQRGTFDELEGTNLYPGKHHSSSEDRSKLKGSYNHGGVPTEVSHSPMAKGKKNARTDDYRSKVAVESCKSQKHNGKVSDKYKDFFGEIDVEEEESQMSPLEMHYDNKAKDMIVAEKKTNSTITLKERSASSKNDKLLKSEIRPMSSIAVPAPGNGGISDTTLVPTAGLANDHWVCCDECQQWRLLPHWINHAELPDNWQCKMMSWIRPGMNHCGISENETTKAVMSSSQVPPVEGQTALQNSYHGAFDLATVNTQQSDWKHQNLGSHGVSTLGKRKHGSKDSSNSSYAGPSRPSSSMKKTIRSSVTNGILIDVNHPSLSNEFDSPRDTSSDLPVKEQKHKKREKNKSFENFSEGGKLKHQMGKGNRETDQDSLRASKKIKSEGLEDLWTDKVDHRSSNNLGSQKKPKYDDNTSNDSKHSKKEQIHLSKRKEAQILQDNGPLDVVEHANGDGMKQRKAKAIHDTGNYFHDLGKDDDKKGKKAKLSMSSEKPSVSTSNEKTSGGTETKGSQRRNRRPGQNPRNIQESLDGVDLLRRDSGSLPSSMAATSSSSKVSNSHKTKANLRDPKGSPVESVSSSPTRAFRQEKFSTRRGNLTEKDAGSTVCPESGTRREQKTPDADSDNHGSLEAIKDCNHASVVKARSIIEPSPNRINSQSIDGVANDMVHHAQRPNKSLNSNQLLSDEMGNNVDHVTGRSKSQASGKGFPLRSKDNNRISSSEFDKDAIKASESIDRQVPSTVKPMSCKSTIEEKFTVNSDESVNKFVDFKDSERLLSKDASNREIQSRGTSSTDVKGDTKTVAGEEKLKSLSPSSENQNAVAQVSQLVVASAKGNRSDNAIADVSNGDDASKVLKEARRVDHSNGTHHTTSRNLLPNGHIVREVDSRSPVKRDPSSQAANNALKEAKRLKHLADRFKNSGSDQEGARLYFESALKFLHGASLFETCSSENARTGELTQAMQIYGSTAKFCEFCAHEYEKCKDMAAGALAYKCAEVAYLRVINLTSTSANRDRDQLQRSLQMIPPGESPSSSASDIDNMNHPTSGDKARLGRVVSSPHVTGSHVIAAQNRPGFVRLLDFVQDVNAAMEASRKSRAAFAAASVNSLEKFQEGLNSVKTALDFGFQDIEEMLHLMKLAFDDITR